MRADQASDVQTHHHREPGKGSLLHDAIIMTILSYLLAGIAATPASVIAWHSKAEPLFEMLVPRYRFSRISTTLIDGAPSRPMNSLTHEVPANQPFSWYLTWGAIPL
jgi:hypothetical protein